MINHRVHWTLYTLTFCVVCTIQQQTHSVCMELILLFLFLLLLPIFVFLKKGNKQPPGPPSLPLLGSLPFLDLSKVGIAYPQISDQSLTLFFAPAYLSNWAYPVTGGGGGGGGAQWAKSEGEAVLLQFSGFTKDPMHIFNRLFCWNSCDCEFWPYIMYLLEYKHEKVHASDEKSLKINYATLILK